MDIPRGGWSGGQTAATPASKYDIRYGQCLLKEESGSWPSYFVVTSPSAFEVTRPLLSSPPVGFNFANTLDWNHLDKLSSDVPNGILSSCLSAVSHDCSNSKTKYRWLLSQSFHIP